MGNKTVSDESGENGSGDENTEFESEEEEPSEEEPNEEDPDEEEPDEVDSGEEPAEGSSEGGPDDENLCEQELDEVASCEVEPDEEDSCEEVSHEEELNEEVCKGEQNDDDQIEEPCEQISDEEPFEEDQDQESCEEEPDEGPCEEEPTEEPSEAEPFEGGGGAAAAAAEEEEEEEKEEEEEVVEEEVEEEKEEEEEEEEEEEPDEDPEYEANEGSAAQSKSGKNGPSVTTGDPKGVSEPSDIQNLCSNANVVEKLSTTGTTGKKRRSRWDTKVDASELTEDGGNIGKNKKKTRWSRWSNEDSKSHMASPLKPPSVVINLEVPNLLSQLFEITKKMQSGMVDDRPENERSPSPSPIYNNLGIQINTREARLRSKLMIQRQKILSELIQKNPNFKPPPDYKGNKLQKKLYIPFKEYPEYNFIGLILGPCGNTQKRMEKETGAKILLRGRGAALNPKKPDPSDNEDMHVLIEADNQYSLDSAVAMVEKLLVPVEDGRNVHKLAQLRELAQMKGNLRGENTGNFKKHDPCDICGDASHPTSACPLTAPTPGTNSNAKQVNFLAEMGGALSPFTGPTLSSYSMGSITSSLTSKPKKEIDDSKLFVGQLPHSVDDNKLMELFSHFGPLFEAKVIRDKHTGSSKGYGFVKYKDHVNAATAVSQMNQHKIDGKMISVRIAGVNNNTGSGGLLSKLPDYPGPALAAVQNSPNLVSWPGPPESKPPETIGGSFPYSSSFHINRSPFTGLSGTTPTSTSLFSRDLATSDDLPETVGGSFPYSSSFQINRSPFGGLSGTTPTSTSLFSRDCATSDDLPETIRGSFPYSSSFQINRSSFGGLSGTTPTLPSLFSRDLATSDGLPVTVGGSFPYSSSFQINRSSFSGISGTTPTSTSLFSRDLTTSGQLSQFPGYLKSLDSPPPPPPPPPTQLYHHQSTMPSNLSSSQDYFSSSLYSRDYFSQNYGSYQRPPT